MFNEASPLRRLLEAPVRPGRVLAIHLRPARRAPTLAVGDTTLDPATGLAGDHGRGTRRGVTLIDAAAVAAIASFLGLDTIDPATLRRNLLVAGINLHALRGARLLVGEAELLVTGECHPCSRMEELFGAGGYNAVRGHGGVTAQILRGGRVAVGDPVSRLPQPSIATPGPNRGS